MIIYWFGLSYFKIEAQNCVLVTDPFDKSSGLKVPRLNADVLVLGNPEIKDDIEIKGTGDKQPFIIDGPGEYEIKNMFVYGLNSVSKNQEDKENNIIYRLESEGISLGYLGKLNHPLENGQLERLEGVDILMVPIGGSNVTINTKEATEMISQIEPRIVIPMYYQLPGLQLKSGKKLESVNNFCKEIGICPTEHVNKFKVTRKDLPQEDLQVVVFEP